MNILTSAALILALSGVHAAPTTLAAVTTNGIVMKAVFGFDIPVTYTPDGRFSAISPGGKIEGVWRIEGDKLCTKLAVDPQLCVAYPEGKKSGDTFPVPGAMGPQLGTVMVRIN